MAYFGGKDQFRASLGIDPAQPIDDADTVYSTVASGLLRPTPSTKISGTTLTSAPLWMKSNPKDAFGYVYDANGSAYSINTSSAVTALSDAGSLTGGLGNGMEYYDNYMYFATGTDITRYGPLNGTAGFVANYWTASGGVNTTALTNTVYPTSFKNGIRYPNHPMCRHSDGKLYIGDVVGNLGAIHVLATTKTSVEGDTVGASVYNKLNFGYGLWPFAIESYGIYLAVALNEVSITNKRDARAKLALWDTTSSSFNQIIWVEYPDPMITALKNVNGVLYVVSGNLNARGFRIMKYLGGYSFEEVFYSETGEPTFPGAVEALGKQFMAGSYTTVPESDGCVYSVGLQKSNMGQGIFNIMRSTGGNASTSVTSMMLFSNGSATPLEFGFYSPTIGWTNGASNGIDQQQTAYNTAPSVWWSQVYKIGQPFKITRIRIPLTQVLAANMSIVPTIYYDDGIATDTLTTIDNTNFPGKRVINLRVNNNANQVGKGQNNFWIGLKWTGSTLCNVALPIEIDFVTQNE